MLTALDFLLRDELRPVRLQLELLKPELVQQEHHIETTVVIYGSARIPSPEKAREALTQIEKEAQEMGKGSFKYAWVLDKLKVSPIFSEFR